MERKLVDLLIEFEDCASEWVPWSADLDASVPYNKYVMRERPTFLLRTKKAVPDMQRTALKKEPITDVKPVDMIYVDLREFGETWAHQCELPGALDSVRVLAVTYTR